MIHLIVCREFPPAVYPPGGIGTYVAHISRLLAEHGETVHVIGQRWAGATKRTERLCGGRLIVHRVAVEDAELYPAVLHDSSAESEVDAMLRSDFPQQWFSSVAAGLAEKLVEDEGIDVIEAQEWEAPLYYFLLRRTLGLGPKRKPPCIVHLHSPTEFIFRHNDWPLSRPEYWPMKRMEDFVIKASDAHLCPSHYLANQCAGHYGLADDIEVIPLPVGSTAQLDRGAAAWSGGSICFSGRLEPRKGVIEFVDAAIAVARDDPTLRFDFVGSDNQFNTRVSVQTLVERRIPPNLKDCFRFHGGKTREELMRILGEARIAAVPSRWENFPNTCLEAMCSGLPVLATRNGGMAEMVADGVTGWLAQDGAQPLADRLAEALRRALACSPHEHAAMGAAAARAIRRMCDNEAIVGRHVDFRAGVMSRGAGRSALYPAAFPWPLKAARPVPLQEAVQTERRRTAVVIVALNNDAPDETVRSAHAQVSAATPCEVIVVAPQPPATSLPHEFLSYRACSAAGAKAFAVESFPDVERWMFLDPFTRLHPGAIDRLGLVLDAVPSAGLVSAWLVREGVHLAAQAEQPAFPYQWLRQEIADPVLYRREAIVASGNFPNDLTDGHEDWAMITAIMAHGWTAPRYPALLASRTAQGVRDEGNFGESGHACVNIAAHFAALAREDVLSILQLTTPPERPSAPGREVIDNHGQGAAAQPEVISLHKFLAMPWRNQLSLSLSAAKNPRYAAKWLVWRARTTIERRAHGR